MDVAFTMKIKAPDGTYVDFADTKGTPVDGATGLGYSVNNYLEDRITYSQDSNMVQLAKDMRAYGAYAKHYFIKRYDTGWSEPLPTFDDFVMVSAEALSDFAPRLPDAAIGHFTYNSSTLVLEGVTRFRLYFESDDPSKLSIATTVNGKQTTLVPQPGTGTNAGRYFVEVPDIVAKRLDDMYVFSISNGSESITMRHGPFAYVRWALSTTDADRENLRYAMAALYNYNRSANVYFGDD
jgi:hypothetical protein